MKFIQLTSMTNNKAIYVRIASISTIRADPATLNTKGIGSVVTTSNGDICVKESPDTIVKCLEIVT